MINQIHIGDCIEVMKTMPDKFVDCCVTSPPYYGLRDYGTATWEGGDAECDHKSARTMKNVNTGQVVDVLDGDNSKCRLCGAIRIDNQIGLEETPEAFVQKLVEVFREVKRVLKDEGTLWLNLGDSYASQGGGQVEQTVRGNTNYVNSGQLGSNGRGTSRKPSSGLKPKDLIGIPWMVAFALRADGWYLRQDIIWHKPNPMPKSVTDRCTKSHEYIFLLSKSQKYYYDHEAIKDDAKPEHFNRYKSEFWSEGTKESLGQGRPNGASNTTGMKEVLTKANKRSVWTVTTKPFKEAHFATFPEDLIVPCIKAGCPEGGVVLDPFGGAGTTAVVAHKLQRKWILTELNPEYVGIAKKRLYPHVSQVSIFDQI